jgi:hypothetical protein
MKVLGPYTYLFPEISNRRNHPTPPTISPPIGLKLEAVHTTGDLRLAVPRAAPQYPQILSLKIIGLPFIMIHIVRK